MLLMPLLLIMCHAPCIVDYFVDYLSPPKDFMKKLKMSNPNNLSKVNGGRADILSKPCLCDFKNLCFPGSLLSVSHFVEFDFYKRGKT